MNTNSDSRAVSPVVGVILVVAITVALSGVVGVFVFDLGQQVSNSNSQSDISTRTTYNEDGTADIQVVTGEADSIHVLVNGTEEANTTVVQPGTQLTVTATTDSSITVISESSGTSTVVSASSPTNTVDTQPTEPTAGLIAHWTFNSGSGTTAIDSAGETAYNAILTNADWVTGKVGPDAIAFPNADGYGAVGDHTEFEGGDGHTATAWVKTSSIEYQDVLSKWDQSDNERNWLLMVVPESGSIYVRGHVADGAGNNAYVDSIQPVATGTWVMVTQTWDGATLRIFINGTDVGSTSFSNALTNTPTNVYIGDREAGTSARLQESWAGSLDDVRYYNRSLSPAEVQDLYNATK